MILRIPNKFTKFCDNTILHETFEHPYLFIPQNLQCPEVYEIICFMFNMLLKLSVKHSSFLTLVSS